MNPIQRHEAAKRGHSEDIGVRYPVNEMFQTVQGEAHWTGTPAVFIRLQGCPVGCGWCDTKHTWVADPLMMQSVPVILGKTADSAAYAITTLTDILAVLDTMAARHVVITGGEPCLNDLQPLTAAILRTGRTVQIETSGTHPIQADPRAWVTVSPKVGMPGGYPVRADAMARANEIKHPVGKLRDVDNLVSLLMVAPIHPDALVWLQPLSQSEKATALCVEQATAHGWRVSIQTHKFMGVR